MILMRYNHFDSITNTGVKKSITMWYFFLDMEKSRGYKGTNT